MATISGTTLIAGTAAAIAAGSSLLALEENFRNQANDAYNERNPDRANDTPAQQSQDMRRDAYRHTYVSSRMAEVAGDDVSHYLGDVNEAAHPTDVGNKNMDYYNNDKGIEYNEELNSNAPL